VQRSDSVILIFNIIFEGVSIPFRDFTGRGFESFAGGVIGSPLLS
jgi:hypothetical protein